MFVEILKYFMQTYLLPFSSLYVFAHLKKLIRVFSTEKTA